MEYVGMPQGVQRKSRLPIRNSRKSMDWLNLHVGLRFERMARKNAPVVPRHPLEKHGLVKSPPGLAVREDGAELSARSCAAQEMLLVRRFVVGIAGRKHHAFHAQCHHFIEEGAHAVRVRTVE